MLYNTIIILDRTKKLAGYMAKSVLAIIFTLFAYILYKHYINSLYRISYHHNT